MMTYYDDALPRFAAVVKDALGDAILNHAFLRDATGRLTFIVLEKLHHDVWEAIQAGAKKLTPWVDNETPIATPDDLFDSSLALASSSFPEFLRSIYFTGFVRVIERRVVGQDWLRAPTSTITSLPPIAVFASHKGGVGRSTALAISAAALSEASYNVLVVDLDVESPGLGTMLLHEAPRFGTLDYFVESAVQKPNFSLLDDLIGTSRMSNGGLIHVVPAVGVEGQTNPQNVLGKISRAYVEHIGDDGQTVSFLDRTQAMVRELCARQRYDAVFIDARAGLNEATAAAVLGLGAEVLLFGVDTPQTFAGYKYLLAHLQRFRPSESSENDWRYRLRMVHAKAQGNPTAQAAFRTRSFEVFSDTLYDLETGIEPAALNFDYDDPNAPHYAWPILSDTNYAEFDAITRKDLFSKHSYDRTFGFFVEALRDKIGLKS